MENLLFVLWCNQLNSNSRLPHTKPADGGLMVISPVDSRFCSHLAAENFFSPRQPGSTSELLEEIFYI